MSSEHVNSEHVNDVFAEWVKPLDWRPDPNLPQCRWFVLCDRPAVRTLSHPVLGRVPVCDRCAKLARQQATTSNIIGLMGG